MPYLLRLICLAASRRPGGYCYAGKNSASGEWVRPISVRATHEISHVERIAASGLPVRVLDLVDIEFDHAAPHRWQTENHVVTARKWNVVGRMTKAQVDQFSDHPDRLWENQFSTANGHFDELTEARADGFDTSLQLISVQDLVLSARMEGGGQWPAKRALRGRFTYGGVGYVLKVTDPAFETPYRMRDIGEYAIGNATLCVSLSEPFHGMAFKLIAAIFV